MYLTRSHSRVAAEDPELYDLDPGSDDGEPGSPDQHLMDHLDAHEAFDDLDDHDAIDFEMGPPYDRPFTPAERADPLRGWRSIGTSTASSRKAAADPQSALAMFIEALIRQCLNAQTPMFSKEDKQSLLAWVSKRLDAAVFRPPQTTRSDLGNVIQGMVDYAKASTPHPDSLPPNFQAPPAQSRQPGATPLSTQAQGQTVAWRPGQ